MRLRPLKRRAFFLNVLTVIGAYWVISTLVTYWKNQPDLSVNLYEADKGKEPRSLQPERNREIMQRNGESTNQNNIPQAQIIYSEYSPIYRKGDPNQAGESGRPVIISKEVIVTRLSPNERKKYDEFFERNSFNEYASNLISIHRSLPNLRDEMCEL
ncbi:unnamed protein product [Dracunculus medinensis]|uniref:Polypeptide N-acetylgalactosaminyltransferase 10 n=1 Tax=Dracunculus medinensis TaxID=318479 RepID=A0A0N4UMA6_DRAME|nr:unnamed protein product [Dracunculus medinensis]